MNWDELTVGDVLHYIGPSSSSASYLVLERVSYISNEQLAIKFLCLDDGMVIDDVRIGDDEIHSDSFRIERRQP